MTKPAPHPPAASNLAVTSMVLGIVSIIGFLGFLLGIPAIILGIIALKKGEPERGMSITGIVTGAVSTVVSLILLIVFIIFVIFMAADASSQIEQSGHQYHDSTIRSSEI